MFEGALDLLFMFFGCCVWMGNFDGFKISCGVIHGRNYRKEREYLLQIRMAFNRSTT
jgi:hypothetical protein